MIEGYISKKLCRQPKLVEQVFAPGVSEKRAGFILSANKKWVNGTEIKYMFMEGPDTQRAVVREAFQKWKDIGIGLSFKEVDTIDESLVRIGFLADGSWSYVGRDILTISKPHRTMNFGWDLTANGNGMTTALHEVGHTIGFQHEHQSPFSGIVWDKEAVYRQFSHGLNGWGKKEIDSNILDQIPPNQARGSKWDPNSIMQYEFGPGLIKEPEPFRDGIFPPGTLSPQDIEGVRSFYPETDGASLRRLEVFKAAVINVPPAGQADFIFTAPYTAKYTFQTFGEMDTVMVITETVNGEQHHLSGDDDSGIDKNTKIILPLVSGRHYFVNIRVMFAAPGTNGGIIVFQ